MELRGKLILELQASDKALAKLEKSLSGLGPIPLRRQLEQELAEEREHQASIQQKINLLDEELLHQYGLRISELEARIEDPATTPGEYLDLHGELCDYRFHYNCLKRSHEQRIPKNT